MLFYAAFNGTFLKCKLETVSIAKPLQNWQHVQTSYLGQIRHLTVGQWSMLTGSNLCGSVYCVAHAGQKNCRNVAISTKFSHLSADLLVNDVVCHRF